MDHNLSHLSPCSKLLAILIPCCSPRFLHFLSLFLPSLSCFLFFQALCRTFFPPPAPVSQQFPAPTPVPRLGRSHVRKGASDTSISSAQGHQSQQHFQGHDERIKRTKMSFQGHDERIKRTKMSSYCEPQYKLQRKKLLESVRWMVLVYITADLL